MVDKTGKMEPSDIARLLEQYGCGPIQFTGSGDALFERHLMFDNVTDAPSIDARERYEAAAHAVRDVLSQRWLRTIETYEREDPKRVYYLSMEFLLGRSLANNITNLRLDPLVPLDHDIPDRATCRHRRRRCRSGRPSDRMPSHRRSRPYRRRKRCRRRSWLGNWRWWRWRRWRYQLR